MLASGDLQLIVLALLSEKPRHGYEIIKAIEEHTSGIYTPSPGVVYPALTYLEEVGYAASEQDGSKKLYRITETGGEHLKKNHASVDEMLDQLARFGQKMARIRKEYAEESQEAELRGPIPRATSKASGGRPKWNSASFATRPKPHCTRSSMPQTTKKSEPSPFFAVHRRNPRG